MSKYVQAGDIIVCDEEKSDGHKKRDAYFSVYNCCIDCPPEIGFDIVSKNFRPHHLHYHTTGKEHPDDLVSLCVACHSEREKKREESQ